MTIHSKTLQIHNKTKNRLNTLSYRVLGWGSLEVTMKILRKN